MFYSHQLLARKAPLGQIWMAATMHAKINRRKLDRINLVRICEEILEPAIPMSLRLSGILMGGVVIVYERKVKLLLDDVNRLLVVLNEAWKTKSPKGTTVQCKRNAQAKREAITLPEHGDTELGQIDLTVDFENIADLAEQRTGCRLVGLDSVDVDLGDLNENAGERDQHQAEAEDITLPKVYDRSEGDANLFNKRSDRFDRFEIEGDDMDITSGEPTQIQHIPVISQISDPHLQNQHQEAAQQHDHMSDEIPQRQEVQGNVLQRHGNIRRRKRRAQAIIMDDDQSILHAHLYQSWLRDTSDIVSKRRKNQKAKIRMSTLNSLKMDNLMDLPPSVLMGGLFDPGNREPYYPAPLLELWKETTRPDDPISGLTSHPLPPERSSLPPERRTYQDSPVEDFHGEDGSQSFVTPAEQARTFNTDLLEEFIANLHGPRGADNDLLKTGNSGDERTWRSISSSSGKGVNKKKSEGNSGGPNKKRRSDDGLSGNTDKDPNLDISRLSRIDPTPDQEILLETGPTQTQQAPQSSGDKVTDAVQMELKRHFEEPGGSQVESLDHLTTGMNRRRAALLFYQTCVLANRNVIKVQQSAPYCDILITRGPNM